MNLAGSLGRRRWRRARSGTRLVAYLVATALGLSLLAAAPACGGEYRRPTVQAVVGLGPLSEYRVRWEAAEPFRPRAGSLETVRRLGPRVRVRGRLVRKDGSRAKYGLQTGMPLRIAIGCRSDSDVDWGAGPGRAWLRQWSSELGVFFGSGETIEIESELDADGSFVGSFPARLIERVVGGIGRHRVVVALPAGAGATAGSTVVSTESALTIPGPAPLGLTNRRINAVPSPGFGVFDPVALVRAVNHLHALGREGALIALDDYLQRLGSETYWPGWRRDAANIDTGHPACVFPIVQLLFEPLEGRPPMPRYSCGLMLPAPRDRYPGDDDYPMLLCDGLPFLVGDWAETRSGPESDPQLALDWAREHGILRQHALRPSGQPLRALELLEGREGIPEGNHPRLQVLRSFGDYAGTPLDDLFPLDADALGVYLPDEFEYAAAWMDFRTRMERVGLRWDSAAQTYRVF